EASAQNQDNSEDAQDHAERAAVSRTGSLAAPRTSPTGQRLQDRRFLDLVRKRGGPQHLRQLLLRWGGWRLEGLPTTRAQDGFTCTGVEQVQRLAAVRAGNGFGHNDDSPNLGHAPT